MGAPAQAGGCPGPRHPARSCGGLRSDSRRNGRGAGSPGRNPAARGEQPRAVDAPPPAAASADLRRGRHPDPVRGDALVQLSELFLGRPWRRALQRPDQLQDRLHQLGLSRLARALGVHDRDLRDRRHDPGGGARAAAGPQVRRPRRGPDPDHPPVPGHARGRGAGVGVADAGPELRADELPAAAVRRAPRGLAQPVSAGLGDRGHDLAVDAVHDADRAGRPAEPADRHARSGKSGRRRGAGHVPRAHAAAPAALHRARHPARLDLPGQRVRRGQADDQRRAGDRHHEPAVLPVPAGELRLRRRRGGRGRRVHRDSHDHRRHVRAADVRPRLPVRGGRSMTVTAVRPGPRRVRELSGQVGWGIVAWVVGIGFFLPVLWMVLTAFKPESAAETWPPKFIFSPTLSQFRLVFPGMGPFLTHSVLATVGSTILVLLLAVPAAYALSVYPVRRWRDGLFFFISTKMLPIVAAIGPLYVIALHTHLLDSIGLMIILYTAMNLPLAIWMIRSFMLEVPGELLEAARLDGAGRTKEITSVILPIVSPGLVSTALICVIFAWNELFLAINLTVTNAATMPMYLISSVPQEGLFIAHLSAAATVASVPVILVGWIAQRSLVRGLSMGAIK